MNQSQIQQNETLYRHLARFGRRLRLYDGWRLAQQTLWVAGLAMALVQVAGRLWPISHLVWWTLAPLCCWLLAVPAVAILRPLSPVRVARRVDLELGLKERLSTAWLLRASKPSFSFQPALIAHQHQDALTVAQHIHPGRAFPLPWQRRSLLVAAVLLAAAVGLALLPNRMDAVLAERAAVAREAEAQARQIENLRQEIEQAAELTPEERQELLRQLEELAQELRDNPGNREQALADLSTVEETLRQKLDPDAAAQQATLDALAVQLQSLAQGEKGAQADPAQMDETLQALAEEIAGMSEAERQALAQSLVQMAARAMQSGDTDLAQALAALAQAAQAGDGQATAEAAQAAADAMARTQANLDKQATLQRALSQLQSSRQALAQSGQGQQGQQGGQGAAQVPGAGQNPGQGQGQGQNQGGQGGQGTGGQGTKADQLPPGTGTGQANRPQGEGRPTEVGELDQQIYVPWDRLPGEGQELIVPGQDTGQGDTQVRERRDPLPGAAGPALVPYHQVYYQYLDAANKSIDQNYIPLGLKTYVWEYFSQLEPQ